MLVHSSLTRFASPLALWEEGTVPFVADLGKRAGRRRQRIRDKQEIAHGRGPLHLRRIADEFARKASKDRVRVTDMKPLVHTPPSDGERHGARYRGRAAAE